MSRSLCPWLLAVPLLMLLSGELKAQEPADTAQAEEEPVFMGQQMQQMMPMMTEMIRQMTQSTMESLAEPETAQNLARFTRNYYDALVAQGFTEEQALRIVSSMGFPPQPSL